MPWLQLAELFAMHEYLHDSLTIELRQRTVPVYKGCLFCMAIYLTMRPHELLLTLNHNQALHTFVRFGIAMGGSR